MLCSCVGFFILFWQEMFPLHTLVVAVVDEQVAPLQLTRAAILIVDVQQRLFRVVWIEG